MVSHKSIIRFIKDWTLLISIILGAIFHDFFGYLDMLLPHIMPVLIFIMLLLSFSKLEPGVRQPPLLVALLLIAEIGLGVATYYGLKPFNEHLAAGLMICVIISSATASPVIVGLMNGDMAFITLFLLISSVVIAFFIPFWFAFIGYGPEGNFMDMTASIALRTLTTLLIPLAIALFTRRFIPKVHATIRRCTPATYYIWAFSLMLLIGRAYDSFIESENPDYAFAIESFVAAFTACFVLIMGGKLIGRFFGKPIAAGQALGQKNTVLAVWLAWTFISPQASMLPTMYIISQNIINSIQLWITNHRKR